MITGATTIIATITITITMCPSFGFSVGKGFVGACA
jgi:hypothetical protein